MLHCCAFTAGRLPLMSKDNNEELGTSVLTKQMFYFYDALESLNCSHFGRFVSFLSIFQAAVPLTVKGEGESPYLTSRANNFS